MKLSKQAVFTAPKIRVFVADNEAVIASTLASILDLAGYEICAVYGGEATLRLMDLLKPDMVVTDITMPGAAPREILSASYLHLPRCRVLLFTGYPDLYYLLRTEDAVSLPFELLTKPILAGHLLSSFRDNLCSDHPPLLIPLETQENPVH